MKARQALEEVVGGGGVASGSAARPAAGVPATMHMNAKCADLFWARFSDAAGNALGEYEGYVPDFMPGEHYGDYVELEVDLKTGQILNWKAPKPSEIRQLIAKKQEGP